LLGKAGITEMPKINFSKKPPKTKKSEEKSGGKAEGKPAQAPAVEAKPEKAS